MGGVAGGALAESVSAAGGLGMIGIGSAGSVELLQEAAERTRRAHLPFGIGLLDWRLARDPSLLDAALEAAPHLISVSFGDDWSWAGRVRDAGVIAATQVSDVASAKRAESSGVQVVVARGAEGGGHGEPKIGTLPLLDSILEAVGVPVLAAGGIASFRGLAAVLAAGASGAWIGTAFAACVESLSPERARRALVQARETDTVTTRIFDIALGYDWPHAYEERVLRNQFADQWSDHEEALVGNIEARQSLEAAVGDEDYSVAHLDAGQGVGRLSDICTATEVIDRMCTGALELLSVWTEANGDGSA
jgi:nitronate monooxygenase